MSSVPSVRFSTSSHDTCAIQLFTNTSNQPNNTFSMSGTSNVGNSAVYEAGDQRNPPKSEQKQATPYEEGKDNSHDQNDPSESYQTSTLLQN